MMRSDALQPSSDGSTSVPLGRFAELWTGNLQLLEGFVRLQVRDHHLAEDIVQEVARDATANLDKYDPGRPFGAWLIGIARMRVAEHYRKQGRRPLIFSSELIDKVERSYVKLHPDISDRQALLETCIRDLNDRHRRLIQMRYESSFSPKQIASTVGVKVSYVNMTIHRIRAALYRCVQEKMEARR